MRTERTVLITGAAGGMGALFVARFLENGDTVVATDTADAALARLSGDHPGALLHTIAADVSDEDSCGRLAAFAKEKSGRVDVVVNAAGFFPITPFAEMSTGEWRKIIDINLTGVFLVTRALLPLMSTRGWGRIINIGSGSVFEGVAGQAHYVAAKAGVVGFSRSIAREVGDLGITVNIVAPGLTVTPAVRERFPAAVLEAQIGSRAIKREEIAEDLVGTVFFLASPDADFISGQTIAVDGGRHMN